MQIDTWLTETSYPEHCPLCSQPLEASSNMCRSCGFRVQQAAPASGRLNLATPIPPRASARRTGQSLPGKEAHQASSQTPARALPTPSPRGTHHNSPNYEAASSLSSLSLIISETPTVPPRSPQGQAAKETGALAHIDEIDTLPPPFAPKKQTPPRRQTARLAQPDRLPADGMLSHPLSPLPATPIEEIDTVPERGQPARPLTPTAEAQLPVVDATSWVASSSGTRSAAARFRAEHPRSKKRHQQEHFHLLDHLRWWLLRPGHIEFLLWLLGSILLLGMTLLLLLATVMSMNTSQTPRWGNLPNSATASATGSTPAGSPLNLKLLGNSRLQPGSELQLQGQGFQPRSTVTFLLDGHWPLLDHSSHAASLQVDASGNFTVNLWLGDGAAWSNGPHQIQVNEVNVGKQVSTPITIISGPIARATEPPTNTGTGTSGQQPTPQPTARPVPPTATPLPPTATAAPTATVGVTPEPSPTAISTPGTPSINATPAPTTSTGSPGLSSALSSNGDDSLFTRLSRLNPLVWLIVACYVLSMVLLCLAGLLRRRRPAKKE